MILKDLHTHTTYCDGKNTPEEMVIAAIGKGLCKIGFSGHCYTFFDERYCMSIPNVIQYITEVNALKEKYKDRIRVLCGVEQDYFGGRPIADFDYVIGSCHYLHWGDDRYTPMT